jgi:uncharacterized membrane protein YdjX (TVP38/TMEM64 family)
LVFLAEREVLIDGDREVAREALPLTMIVDMRRGVWTRWLPLALVVAAIAAALVLRLDRYLDFGTLALHRDWLLREVEEQGALGVLAFIAGYAGAIGLSIPGATVLTLMGGFLFGPLWGTVYAVLGATLGATAIFLIARTAFGDVLRRRAGPFTRKLEDGFRRDSFYYLLFLRLVPFPFWLVNLVPALLGVRLATYVGATFIGIIPATAVYAGLGDGLGAVLDAGETPDLGIVLQPRVLLPLLALGVLALLPVAVRHWRHNAAGEGA